MERGYKVHVGYSASGRDRWRHFESYEAARDFCQEAFERTGKILAIHKD